MPESIFLIASAVCVYSYLGAVGAELSVSGKSVGEKRKLDSASMGN